MILASLGAALVFIARTSGAGWMIVIASGVAAVLVVAVGWPTLALRRLRVVVSAPRDATVGRPVLLSVRLEGPRRHGLVLRLADPVTGWVRTRVPVDGELLAVPSRRGVLSSLMVELRCAAPLGLVSRRRRFAVALVPPLEVGPSPVGVPMPQAALAGGAGGEPRAHSRLGRDLVRTVREYVPGDQARLVHWPATARRGELMVKELDQPEQPHVVVVVDLRGPAPAAEDAASRAAGLAGAILGAGLTLVMATAERKGQVVAQVRSGVEAGRRLARSGNGAPPSGGFPAGSVVVRVSAR